MPGILPDITPAPAKNIQLPSELEATQQAGGVQPPTESFASMLGKMVSEVNLQQNGAMQSVNALQAGQNVPLHQAVIAMEEANVSFQLMVEVRNRMLDAYQEVMRMQI